MKQVLVTSSHYFGIHFQPALSDIGLPIRAVQSNAVVTAFSYSLLSMADSSPLNQGYRHKAFPHILKKEHKDTYMIVETYVSSDKLPDHYPSPPNTNTATKYIYSNQHVKNTQRQRKPWMGIRFNKGLGIKRIRANKRRTGGHLMIMTNRFWRKDMPSLAWWNAI